MCNCVSPTLARGSWKARITHKRQKDPPHFSFISSTLLRVLITLARPSDRKKMILRPGSPLFSHFWNRVPFEEGCCRLSKGPDLLWNQNIFKLFSGNRKFKICGK
ncbi:hypothetical protein CEXT_184981 [Caerostris extrusa]|uniref:Uncharacterized protein n=1 Tax=Caerostris extrusa TaxID=172846 RepID=A0AAV4TAL0_CAEEX|nr:hypothetical protein CEXT_184981 [Caerostris extrusa]